MTGPKGRRARCFRCIYVWRPRRAARPKVCPRCKSHLYTVPRIQPVGLGKGPGIEELLGPHRAAILRIAREHGARNVRVFGSVRAGFASYAREGETERDLGARVHSTVLADVEQQVMAFRALHAKLRDMDGGPSFGETVALARPTAAR